MSFSSLPSEIVNEILSYMAPTLCDGSSSNLWNASRISKYCRLVCQPILYKDISVRLHVIPLLLRSVHKTPSLLQRIETLRIYPTDENHNYETVLSDVGRDVLKPLAELSSSFFPQDIWYTSAEAWLALLLAHLENIKHFEWYIRSPVSHANDYMYFNEIVRAAASKNSSLSGLQRLSTTKIHLDKERYVDMNAILRLPCLSHLNYTNSLICLTEKIEFLRLRHLEIQHDCWSVLVPDIFTPILRACGNLNEFRLCIQHTRKPSGWRFASYVIQNVIEPLLTSRRSIELIALDLPVEVRPLDFGYLKPFEKLRTFCAPATMIGRTEPPFQTEVYKLPQSLETLNLSMRTATTEFKDSISSILGEYLQIEHLSTSIKELNLLWPFAPEDLPEILRRVPSAASPSSPYRRVERITQLARKICQV